MVRFLAAFLLILGLPAVSFAAVGPYVEECSPGTCIAMDGTTQPAGTFIREFAWDGVTPFQLPDGVIAVPFTGQTIYQPAASLATQVTTLFNTGFTLTSTGTPALNGVYPVSTVFMQALQQEELCLLATGTEFCNLQTTQPIPDSSGTLHTFDKAHFNNFLLNVGNFLATLINDNIQILNGGSPTLPTPAATIP